MSGVGKDRSPSAEQLPQIRLKLAVDMTGVNAERILRRRDRAERTCDLTPEIRLAIINCVPKRIAPRTTPERRPHIVAELDIANRRIDVLHVAAVFIARAGDQTFDVPA